MMIMSKKKANTLIVMTFKDMMAYYKSTFRGKYVDPLKKSTINSYDSYLRSVDKANGGITDSWISNAILSRGSDPVMDAVNAFDNFFNGYQKVSPKTISNWKAAYRSLAETIIGIFYANVWAFTNNRNNQIFLLCQIVAQNALFASKDIVDGVINGKEGTPDNKKQGGNSYASWDHMLHVRDNSVKKGTQITVKGYSCIADDNTSANHYIKQAIIKSLGLKNCSQSLFRDYEACHVWDKAYDPRYYASIANLILVPRAYGQLTDHCPEVKEMLRFEVYNRFGFLPQNEPVPNKPKFYDKIIWR